MFLGLVVPLQVSVTCEVQVAKVTLQLVAFRPLKPVPLLRVRVVNDLLEDLFHTFIENPPKVEIIVFKMLFYLHNLVRVPQTPRKLDPSYCYDVIYG
jgi:hypothetical protein